MSDILTIEDDGLDDLTSARIVATTLETHYPGYLWEVSGLRGGGIFVKCGQTAHFGTYGYYIQEKDVCSASDLARLAVLGGGELLERAGLPCGRWNGEIPTRLEGADPRHRRYN
jgi:hypothetical protein